MKSSKLILSAVILAALAACSTGDNAKKQREFCYQQKELNSICKDGDAEGGGNQANNDNDKPNDKPNDNGNNDKPNDNGNDKGNDKPNDNGNNNDKKDCECDYGGSYDE